MKFKKSSLWIKALILIVVVYAAVTLDTLQSQITAKREEAEALSKDVTSVTQENQRLQEDIDLIGTDEGVEDIARSKLGMGYSDEIIFQDASK